MSDNWNRNENAFQNKNILFWPAVKIQELLEQPLEENSWEQSHFIKAYFDIWFCEYICWAYSVYSQTMNAKEQEFFCQVSSLPSRLQWDHILSECSQTKTRGK